MAGPAMRALTLRQPWAWAIVHGQKRIENRPWKPWRDIIGQRIAIHAGLITSEAEAAPDQVRWFFGPFGWVLSDVRPCEQWPCRGARGLWQLPADCPLQIEDTELPPW